GVRYVVTEGDCRFGVALGGKSWVFYPIERLGGIHGHCDTSRGWMQRHGLRPGRILWEVQEAYQPGVVTAKLTRGPLEYTALWKVAQRLTDRPLKFGAICAPALASMLWDEHYKDDKALINDLSDIMNAEFRELSAAGCPLIQVEEPPHHGRTTRPDCTDADLEFLTEALNRQLRGVDAAIGGHTCWGKPNDQAGDCGPPARLVMPADGGFGREGLSRRIAYYKCVALVEGTNIVRRELGLPEARVRAADPRLWFESPR